MRVAAIQMISGKDTEANLQVAERLLNQAAAEGAQLAVLPENFACYGRGNLRAEGERESQGEGEILPFLQNQARSLSLWLVGGTIPLVHSAQPEVVEADGQRIYAASCVFNPDGNLVARYDKVHLFDVDVADGVGSYRESDTICPGKQPQTADTPWGKLGLSVCYDLRFPEHYRSLLDAGAEILCVPSAFTYTTGQAHWEVLLRARAIETQCFVVAANQGGWHDTKRRSYGHSCIIHPWGQVLAQRSEGEGVVVADLNMEELRQCRARMPIQKHRRGEGSGKLEAGD